MKSVNDKLIRHFKDKNNTIYKIYKKANNHYYLTIKKEQEKGARIIEGSRNSIFNKLKEMHKDNYFMDIEEEIK